MTEPLGPPPIEPLSDIAWSRVERGLWSRLDAAPAPAPPARRWSWAWFAAPALAAAAIAVIVIGLGGPDEPAHGTAARIVSSEAPSSIQFGDAHVTLDPDSAVVMERDGSAALLERGGASFAVAPRRERSPFTVRAGATTIRVIGTRFRVARSAEITTVEVERGVIELQHHETMLELRAGQRWSSADASRTAEITRDPPVPVPVPVEPPPAAVDDPQVANKTAKPPPKVARQEPKQKPEPKKLEPKPPKLDARAKFERLAAIEARDPRAAITGYLELAAGSDSWAELSLFAAGRLAHDRRDPRAKALLERYVARYPRGANLDDARELLASLRRP